MNRACVRSAIRVAGACVGFAVVHSFCASSAAKRAAERLLGRRYRYGLYRVWYVAGSGAACLGLAGWLTRQPDCPLYVVRGPLGWALRGGQAASLALLLVTIHANGLAQATGLAQLLALIKGREPQPEPEAQGPALAADGSIAVRGPFRLTRHPGDLAALGIFLLNPRLSVNGAVVALCGGLYALLGAFHEEARLRAAYGEAYERYRCDVPFLLPRLRLPARPICAKPGDR